MMQVYVSICLALLLVASTTNARGYISNAAIQETKDLPNKPTDDNEVNKYSEDDASVNSVETSPLLNHPDPLLTNIASEVDLNGQILVQLKEMNDQLAALRKTVSNLKYQSHSQYKQMRRVQASCDSMIQAGGGDGGAVFGASNVIGGSRVLGGAVGDEQSNMIRTAALRMEPQMMVAQKPAPLCPDAFEYNPETRSCYLFGSDRITWRMAREKCMIMGADLVTIETNREQRFIVDKAKAGSDLRHCDFWTGATDQDSEGHWYWVANKKPLMYSAWNYNEPNNGNGDEHCMHMLWVFGWSWNDARCNYDSACYICEIHGKGKGWQ